MEPAATVRNSVLITSLVNWCPMTVPTNVGPPPIKPIAKEAPRGTFAFGGERCHDPKPLRRVVKCEADDENGGETDGAGSGAVPDGKAFTEMCSPMPTAMRRARRRAGDHSDTPRRAALTSATATDPGGKGRGRPRPASHRS